jgi:hypothetical protein
VIERWIISKRDLHLLDREDLGDFVI